jgi:undecaprenyl pyrophosphate phosphatase UppP
MRDRLLRDWDFTRALRLVFALVFLAAAITNQEPVAYAAAAFFGMQAVFNIGCCGAACAPGSNRSGTNNAAPAEITYEEIR